MPGSYSDRSLEELQRLFAEGDAEALAELVRRYDVHLRACARRWAGGHMTVAEDGYSEFLVSVSKVRTRAPGAKGAYLPDRPWLPWARVILRNAVYTTLGKLRPPRPVDERLPEGTASEQEAAFAQAVWAIFRHRIESPEVSHLRAGSANPGEAADTTSLSLQTREEVARLRTALEDCLQRLTDAEQQLIADRFWGNKRSHEYAGIAATTIRKRLELALKALKKCVSSKIPGGGHDC
jgi:RNA polymerase sigma factor (sigma-70 family)